VNTPSHELGDIGVAIFIEGDTERVLHLGGIQYDLQSGFCLEQGREAGQDGDCE
jgi:hypothetical protein